MPFEIPGLSWLSHALESPSRTQGNSAHTGAEPSFWHTLVAHVAAEAGIDPDLAVGVAAQESGLNPHAVNRSSGALGIMQLKPSTAAELGVDPYDAVGNVVGGIRYLREQLQNFGDTAKALAAYNWGPRHVAEAVERWGNGWLQHAPGETQRYINAILSRTANLDPVPSPATASSTTNPIVPETVPSSSSHHLDPALLAEALNLRAAMNAYLLSEILD